MPMEETDIPCPVCEKNLTDVDGMLECQNAGDDGWHFVFFDPSMFTGGSHMNWEAWAKYHVGSSR